MDTSRIPDGLIVSNLPDPTLNVGELRYYKDGDVRVWDGSGWSRIYSEDYVVELTPTEDYAKEMAEKFEKYPALKDAWDQYLLIHKMVIQNE